MAPTLLILDIVYCVQSCYWFPGHVAKGWRPLSDDNWSVNVRIGLTDHCQLRRGTAGMATDN